MNKSNICIRFTILIFVNVSFYFNVGNAIDQDEGFPAGKTENLCKKTVEVSHGNCTFTDNGNNGLSHECTLTCQKYYQVKPSISLVCGFKKQWIGAWPSCERVLCDKPNPPKNGLAKCSSTNVAKKYSSCILTCENQYKMSNEKNNKDELTIQCYLDSNGNPTWDSFPSECKSSLGPFCKIPEAPMNGYLKCNDSKVKPNLAHQCFYHCNKGFFLEGSECKNNAMIIKCLGNDKWNISLPRCISALCEPIKDIIKGSAVCKKGNQYIECEIKCDPGYSFRKSDTWTTKNTGCYLNRKGVYEYDNYYKECFLTPCKRPNLIWPLDGKCTDHHCQLWCAMGYQFEGKNKMDCFNDVWSESMPICKNPAKFPIAPQPCIKQKGYCVLVSEPLVPRKNILKQVAVICYDWKELFLNHSNYLLTQYKLTESEILKIKNSRTAVDCGLVTDIVGKYDGKRNCDELCRKSYLHNHKHITIGGYNVGNVNVTRTCICVLKHFYNYNSYV